MPRPTVKQPYENRSLQRALAILNTFSMTSPALTLRELSERLVLHRSTVYRLAVNLVAAGVLKYDDTTRKYSLGLRLFELGAVVVNDMNLPIKARPYLVELRNRTDETVHLGILDGTDVVYVEKFESSHSLKLSGLYGSRRPLYATALGRVLLAGLPPEEARARVLASGPLVKRTPHTVNDIDSVMRKVQQVREQGYSYDDQETEIGLRCIAAPVRDFSGAVVAAVGISGPAFRIHKDRLIAFRQAVEEAAAAISQEIGYSIHTAEGPAPSAR